MAYELENLVSDCRTALGLGRSKEPLENVCNAMKEILQNPGFAEQYFCEVDTRKSRAENLT